MMNCNGTIAVIKNRGKSMEAAVYMDELSAVKAMINNGSLGTGDGYGGSSHKKALDDLDVFLREVRANIAEQEALDMAVKS